MQIFKFEGWGGRVFINHHDKAPSPLISSIETACFNTSTWYYNYHVDISDDENEPQQEGGSNEGGDGGKGRTHDVKIIPLFKSKILSLPPPSLLFY